MKGVFVIIDGLGDLPHPLLKGKTPLEDAKTPNLDFFSSKGKLGNMYPINKNVVPESDAAVLSILGNNLFGSFRGYLEALGGGVKITAGDLSLRTNFATVDNLKDKRIIDRRAGRTLTTKEAGLLAESINKQIKLPC